MSATQVKILSMLMPIDLLNIEKGSGLLLIVVLPSVFNHLTGIGLAKDFTFAHSSLNSQNSVIFSISWLIIFTIVFWSESPHKMLVSSTYETSNWTYVWEVIKV